MIITLTYVTLGECSVGEFECMNFNCIGEEKLCDDIFDCSDDESDISDEHDCKTCSKNAFQ